MREDIHKKAYFWQKFYKRNRHYHDDIKKLLISIVPKDAALLVVGTKGGEILQALPNKIKVGVEEDMGLINFSRKKYKNIKIFQSIDQVKGKNAPKLFDYIFLDHSLAETKDVQRFIKSLVNLCHSETRVVVTYFNYFWKPALDVIKLLRLRMPDFSEPNWLAGDDIDNFFYLENFEKVKSGKRFIFPFGISKATTAINKYISQLPVFNSFCLTNYAIYRVCEKRKDMGASIIIPARNESGNMKGVLSKIPRFTKNIEVVFVEGNSTDDTYEAIQKEIKRYKGPIKASLFKQKGKGKGDAVRLGFAKAKNELFMILDADLTVDPKELPKFYKAIIENKGDLVMGSRLIYPMEKLAMRTLNIIGNKLFSILFSYLLGQKIKDTLCGTKVLLKRDYEKIAKNRNYFGDFDPFGDYDLIFGAAKLNMKIIEIPIRYKERTYGTTNISRFTHGGLLVKMCIFAAKRLKFV